MNLQRSSEPTFYAVPGFSPDQPRHFPPIPIRSCAVVGAELAALESDLPVVGELAAAAV